MKIALSIDRDQFRLAEAFTISRGSRSVAQVLTVTLRFDGLTGRGECCPYARYGESIDSVAAQIESIRSELEKGAGRDTLAQLLPPGAARNAVDCALWQLDAKRAGVPIWRLAGLGRAPEPVTTAYTLSLDTPDAMRQKAHQHSHRPLLKIKLGGTGDLERLYAVRLGAPKAGIIVDANEGWSADTYLELAPVLLELGVRMVEQPLPAGDDELLANIERSLPVCADEACHDTASLHHLIGKYDMINIKLDKTGGLTEALALRDQARNAGFDIMVGCMVASSLAMAPAVLLAQGADIVDLDAPLLLAEDREPPLTIIGSVIQPPVAALWG